ncbi:10093_t:CDS:1, partial [Dentiscutata erythropus]
TNQQEFATQTDTLPKNSYQKILTESFSGNISVTEPNQMNNTNSQE